MFITTIAANKVAPANPHRSEHMNITILGAGNMGSALARQLSRAGHKVRIATRSPEKGRAAVAASPGAVVTPPSQALGDAEVVIVATGYADAVPALRSLGSLAGRIVIDITNPLTPDFSGLTVGHDTSAAEEIAKAFPEAEVVKAFNTVFAQVLADGPAFSNGQTAPVFVAADSERAKEKTKAIVQSIGFKPVDAGPLRHARYLEPLAALNIYLGYGAGHGTAIAPTWIRKAA
jgi:predicted dinucleotide-binding enzyme